MTRDGNTLASGIEDIVAYLKAHCELFIVARLNAIKTIIVYK